MVDYPLDYLIFLKLIELKELPLLQQSLRVEIQLRKYKQYIQPTQANYSLVY